MYVNTRAHTHLLTVNHHSMCIYLYMQVSLCIYTYTRVCICVCGGGAGVSFKAQAYNCESVGETQLSRLYSSHLLFLIHGRFSVNYLQATFILNLHQHCLFLPFSTSNFWLFTLFFLFMQFCLSNVFLSFRNDMQAILKVHNQVWSVLFGCGKHTVFMGQLIIPGVP